MASKDLVVIETRDPFSPGVAGAIDGLVEGLARSAPTTVVLAQNGVLAARRASVAADRLARLAATARVLADDFSLRERGIRDHELVPGVAVTTMERLVELVTTDGCKVMWH